MKQRWLVLLGIGFLLDRLVKFWVLSKGNYWLNQGAAWGWWPSSNWVWVGFLVLVGLGYWSRFVWPSALVIAGGLGNLIDRLAYNGVVDYLTIGWLPRFNLADVMIVTGVLVWLVKEGRVWSLR